MAREPQELTEFTSLPTPVGSESAGLLWVPERVIREGGIPPLGTTLKNFMPGKVSKGDAVGRGFGDYVFTRQGGLEGGWRSFYFARVRSSGEIATAFRTETQIRLGMSWPAVLTSVATGNLLAYNDAGGTYIASTVWKPVYAVPEYDGPTKVVVEWFASHAPFSLGAASGMQPTGLVLDYGIGSVSIPPCLHGTVTLRYEIPSNHPNYPAQGIEDTFPATTPVTRPSTLVLSDGFRFEEENGLYIRRRETAYAPS